MIAEAVKLAKSTAPKEALDRPARRDRRANLHRLAEINDESMLNKPTSRYRGNRDRQDAWASLRVASVRGGSNTYAISTGFAYQGSARWTVSVLMQRRPDDSEMASYCETLNMLRRGRRGREQREPKFPSRNR